MDGPAFRAGLNPGMRLVGVNGQPFSLAGRSRAVAETPSASMSLDRFRLRTAHDPDRLLRGLRYPWLERLPNRPDRLSPLLSSR